METKRRSGSGIGRIFSLSLSEAFSSKKGAACSGTRNSPASSPENEKPSDGQPDYFADGSSRIDTQDKREHQTRSSPLLQSDHEPDSHCDSEELGLRSQAASFQPTSDTPLNSTKRLGGVHKSPDCDLKLKDGSLNCRNQRETLKPPSSQKMTGACAGIRGYAAKVETPKVISERQADSEDGTFSHSCRNQRGTLKLPSSQKMTGACTGISGYVARVDSESRCSKLCNNSNNNEMKNENHTYSRIKHSFQRYQIQTPCRQTNPPRARLNNHSERKLLETKAPQKMDSCSGAVSVGYRSQHSSRKKENKQKKCDHKHTHKASAVSDYSVSMSDRSRTPSYSSKQKPPFKKNLANKVIMGREKENLTNCLEQPGSTSHRVKASSSASVVREVNTKPRDNQDGARAAASARPHSVAGKKERSESNSGSRSTCHHTLQRNDKCGGHWKPSNSGKLVPSVDKRRIGSAAPPLSHAGIKDSRTRVRCKDPGTEVNDQGKMLATRGKFLSKESHGPTECWAIKDTAGDSDKSKVGAGLDAKNQASIKSSSERDTSLQQPVIVNRLENDQVKSSAFGDEKVVYAEKNEIAKSRQSSVVTRMRGSSRQKTNISHVNFSSRDETIVSNVSKEEWGNFEGTRISKSDAYTFSRQADNEGMNKDLSGEIEQKDFTKENGNSADQEVKEKRTKEVVLKDFDDGQSASVNKNENTSRSNSKKRADNENPGSVTDKKSFVSANSAKPQEQSERKKSDLQPNSFTSSQDSLDTNVSNSYDFDGMCCAGDGQNCVNKKAQNKPVPLMSLRLGPITEEKLASLSEFELSLSEEDSEPLSNCSSDSSEGFSRKECKSKSAVSSSSSRTTFFSTLCESKNLSSAASYASFSSDESKAVLTQEPDVCTKEGDYKRHGMRKECFDHTQKIPPSGQSDNREKPQAAASKIESFYNKADIMQPHCMQDELVTRRRIGTLGYCVGQTEEAQQEKLSSRSVLTDDQRQVEQTDVTPHESSTDTVTDVAQGVSNEGNSSPITAGETKEKVDPVRNVSIHLKSDAEQFYLESPQVYDQLDSDARGYFPFDHAARENPGSDCLQPKRVYRFWKRKPGINAPKLGQTGEFATDVSTCGVVTNEEHTTGHVEYEIWETQPDADGSSLTATSPDTFSSSSKPGTVTCKPPELKGKGNDHTKLSNNEHCQSKLKEAQNTNQKLNSASGSENSESVSAVSDSFVAGSDLCMKNIESDQKCRMWVKKTENWSGKVDEDSQSDKNFSLLHLNNDRSPEVTTFSVYEEEVLLDSDISQTQGTFSLPPPKDHDKKQSVAQTSQRMRSVSESSQCLNGQALPLMPDRKGRRYGSHSESKSKSVTLHQTRESKFSKSRTHESHKERDDNRTTSKQDGRKLVLYKSGGHSLSRKKCVYSDTDSSPVCGHNSLSDLPHSTKMQTSSSSDCDIDVLSQCDYDDLSARMMKSYKLDERPSHHQNQSLHDSKEFRSDMCQNSPYSLYGSHPHAQPCFSPYHPETYPWLSTHPLYDYEFEQWYSWAAFRYSMDLYGSGFQEGERGMDYSEQVHASNCGCCSASSQRDGWPPSQPPLRAPSMPCQDPRVRNDARPNSWPSNENFSKDTVLDSETHKQKMQESGSAPYEQVCQKNELTGLVDRPDVSAQGLACTKKAEKESSVYFGSKKKNDSEFSTLEGSSSTLYRKAEPRNVQSNFVSLHSRSLGAAGSTSEKSRPGLLVDAPNALGEHSMRANVRYFSPCHSNMPMPTPLGDNSNPQNCRHDFSGYPGHQYPRNMPPPFDPFRFRIPPQFFHPRSPFQATQTRASSSCGDQGDRKENAPGESYHKEQEPYKECKIPPFSVASLYPPTLPHDWNLQRPFLMPPPPPLPPTLPPPTLPDYPRPIPRNTMSHSQTSGSLDTTSSEPSRANCSFDTRGDYDASGSEQEEANVGARKAAANARRKCSGVGVAAFGPFAAAQHERYQMYLKDSGSEDSGSLASSSKQPNVVRTGSGREEEQSPRSAAVPKSIPSVWRGHMTPLYRQSFAPRGRFRRSCPPAVESVTGVASGQQLQSGSARLLTPPPASLSYAQAAAPPGASWNGPLKRWDQPSQPGVMVYGEDYPSLSAAASSYTQRLMEGEGSQTASFASTTEDNSSLDGVQEDGTCKGFFRSQSSLEQFGRGRAGRWAMSRYASRLLCDNRLAGVLGKSGREAAREAFDKEYQTSFIDTHCHLDFLFNREPYSGTYASYQEKHKTTFPQSYEGCVAVFCKPKTFGIKNKWMPFLEESGVWMAMGCHPKNACEYTERTEQELRQALKHRKTVALGEIGLDYSKHYGQSSGIQKSVFISQLKVALAMNLPLVIHCREAEDDCLQILEQHVPADYKIHCHCFTCSYESALKWTSRFKNLFIGLTPLVTYRSAVDTHEVAKLLPLEKLLLETDAPYFLPSGFEGCGLSLSHPGLALTVAIRVAELRGIQVEEVLTHVRRNTREMYGI